MKTISYCITVCNEIEEIIRLINNIVSYIREEDELIIQADSQKVSEKVKEYLDDLNLEVPFHIVYYPLNNDFSAFKNNLKSKATKDYLIFLDADEIPSENLMGHIPKILDENDVDVYILPRCNTVDGLTEEWIRKWGWSIDKENRVNYPDYQMRIIKNDLDIRWYNKVHEIIKGYKTIYYFPCDTEDWCLYHPKSIDKQIKQNQLYDKIS